MLPTLPQLLFLRRKLHRVQEGPEAQLCETVLGKTSRANSSVGEVKNIFLPLICVCFCRFLLLFTTRCLHGIISFQVSVSLPLSLAWLRLLSSAFSLIYKSSCCLCFLAGFFHWQPLAFGQLSFFFCPAFGTC